MLKSGIDQQALIDQFAQASAKQTAQLRSAVTDATLKALQGREMSLKNIRAVVKSVTEAASAGAAQNPLAGLDPTQLLQSAVDGLDDALLKAVEANRVALGRLVEQGVDLGGKQMHKALDDLEKLEDTMLEAVRKAASSAAQPLMAPWEQVLGQFAQGGGVVGTQAHAAVEQLSAQAQAMVRESRAAGLKAAKTLAESYSALVSGVLMGMADAMRQGAATPAPAAKTRRKTP